MERLMMLAKPSRLLPCIAALVLLVSPAAAAWDTSGIAGYVDPDCLVGIADVHPEITIVEVTIPGSILRPIGLGLKENPDLQQLVFGLEWVSAVILETEDDQIARTAQACMKDTESRLTRKGWERLARIREEGATVNVLILNGNETVRGLVVLISEEGEFVMTNLAGVINLELLSELSDEVDIPGLDQIPENN
jgi:hypothetical protein